MTESYEHPPERIAAELRGEVWPERKRVRPSKARGRLEPDADWVTTEDAMRILGFEDNTSGFKLPELMRYIRRRSRSLTGAKSSRGVGALWNREDCERVRDIAAACRLSRGQAARVALALRGGAI